MRLRIFPKTGWVHGWMWLVALALCLAASGAQARTRTDLLLIPAQPAQLRLSLPLPDAGAGAAQGKTMRCLGPVATQRTALAQVSEGESGGDRQDCHDLMLGPPVALAAPVRPESAGGHPAPGPELPSGSAAAGTRPRPPPSL